MAMSDARKRANRKYNEKAYDRIELKVSKGKKADLQAHAADRGESLNGFVNRAIDETMKRETPIKAVVVRKEPEEPQLIKAVVSVTEK